jgi:DNA-binding MarR family transcriptional regulator
MGTRWCQVRYTSADQGLEVDALLKAFELFSELKRGTLHLHHMQVFLAISKKGACTYEELESLTGLTNASISRTVNSLAKTAKHTKTPLGLIEIERDPLEGRRFLVKLAPAGKALSAALQMI